MGQLVGEIKLFPYDDMPYGWMPCCGQSLMIGDYPKLYTMLGTKFGGEGASSFRLPDLRGEARPGFTFCIAVEGDIPRMNDTGIEHIGG